MSAGKVAGLVIILISIFFMSLAILFNMGFPVTGFLHKCSIFSPGMFATRIPHGPGFMFIPAILVFIVWLVMTFWVFSDAEKRGMNGLLWALLVFFGHILALVVYLLVRNDQVKFAQLQNPSASCPACRKPLESGFAFCPHCGEVLESTCSNCKKPVEQGWQVCPHCAEKLGEG